MTMKRTFIIGLILLVAVVAVLDVFVFRFHTYFQSTEVQETLPPMPSDAPAAMQPKTVVSGSFANADIVHRGSGTARIVEQDGKRYLRLEDFEVTNGPDLYVYLSESKTPGDTLESLDKYINVGKLKGNKGNQTYELPDFPFQGYDTAVIWCQEFGVLFSYAVMQ